MQQPTVINLHFDCLVKSIYLNNAPIDGEMEKEIANSLIGAIRKAGDEVNRKHLYQVRFFTPSPVSVTKCIELEGYGVSEVAKEFGLMYPGCVLYSVIQKAYIRP